MALAGLLLSHRAIEIQLRIGPCLPPLPPTFLHYFGIQTVGFEQSFRAVVKVHAVILSSIVHEVQSVAQRAQVVVTTQLSMLPEVTC